MRLGDADAKFVQAIIETSRKSEKSGSARLDFDSARLHIIDVRYNPEDKVVERV